MHCRTGIFLLIAGLVTLCAADTCTYAQDACSYITATTFTGQILAGQSTVTIPYGTPQPNHGLIINSNANFSTSLITTLEATYTYATWSSISGTWEGTWTATYCAVGSPAKDVSITIGCHSTNAGSQCQSDVAYTITVTEYNATLDVWNPDEGPLRWLVTLGGTGTSVMYNLTLDDENSTMLTKRADLHFSVISVNDTPSSSVASLYSFGSTGKACACNLTEDKPEEHSMFAGASAMFLTKTTLKVSRQYVFVLNATEPRQSYWIIAHVTPGAKRSGNIWVFIAVAIACFLVGGVIAGIGATVFCNHGKDEEKEPFIVRTEWENGSKVERGDGRKDGKDSRDRRSVN